MSEKIWLKEYPAGVPAEIDAERYTSIANLIDSILRKFADKPVCSSFGRGMSYAGLGRHSRDLDRLRAR